MARKSKGSGSGTPRFLSRRVVLASPAFPVFALALVALVGVGIVLAHGGSGDSGAAGDASAATPTLNPIAVSSSRDYSERGTYLDLKKLKKDADAVVIGVITSKAASGMQNNGDATAFGYTDWKVQLVSVVYDRHHVLVKNGVKTTQSIVVRQRGGIVDNQLYTTDDDPMMAVGERYLFFLHAGAVWSNTPDTTTSIPLEYSTVGDGQGRFLVTGGMIHGNVFKNIQFAKDRTEADVTSEVMTLPEN